jgi:transcriptional antiterminator NusG
MKYTNWYTLRVLSGKENSIKDILPHIEGYDKCVEEVLIPNEKTVRMRGKKKIVVNKNLLPGYMFIKFKTTPPNPDFVKLVEQTKFVSSFLIDSSGKPVALNEDEFKKIVGNVEQSQKKVDRVSKGEEIVVIDGPFDNFKGVVLDVDPEKDKLRVIVKVFGRDTTLDLNLSQVERQ